MNQIYQQRLADYKSGEPNMSKRIRILLVLAASLSLLSSSIFAGYHAAAQRKGVVVAASNPKNAASLPQPRLY